ncbi:Allergen Asp f 7 [Tolypocladium paradoxum]|uniref:Allergen Asp f 7 n=1 Tax=Tolypocladium paradoxum TaxID=94208 RepID=A0A2S4KWW1_9HYPO|nr:Allergen Asp f 7 [Tolypocladium paradoxum]
MKTAAVASAVFAAAAAAQPRGHGHQHKHAARAMVTEIKWVTETEYVTKIVDATTTLWKTPGQEPTPTVTSAIKGNFFEPPSSASQAPPASAAAPPPPPPPPQSSTTSSVYTPPPPPPTPTSSVYVPPPPPPQQAAPSSGGGTGVVISAKGPYEGEITYYDVGMGACGYDDSDKGLTENIVAIAVGRMGDKSNGNELCNQTITIHANGKSTTAKVRDKCMGCKPQDIDVSRKVYLDLWGGYDTGRMPCTWEFN